MENRIVGTMCRTAAPSAELGARRSLAQMQREAPGCAPRLRSERPDMRRDAVIPRHTLSRTLPSNPSAFRPASTIESTTGMAPLAGESPVVLSIVLSHRVRPGLDVRLRLGVRRR